MLRFQFISNFYSFCYEIKTVVAGLICSCGYQTMAIKSYNSILKILKFPFKKKQPNRIFLNLKFHNQYCTVNIKNTTVLLPSSFLRLSVNSTKIFWVIVASTTVAEAHWSIALLLLSCLFVTFGSKICQNCSNNSN